jgi:hypothetical protein
MLGAALDEFGSEIAAKTVAVQNDREPMDPNVGKYCAEGGN